MVSAMTSTADIMDRLEDIALKLEALTDKLITLQAKPSRPAAESTLTPDQLDALAIDAIGNVLFEVRVRDGRRVCEVSRKALFDYLTSAMELPRHDAYAVNDHIASRPAVDEFKVRNSVWFRWAEEAELFPIATDAEVVELKPATPRRIL